MNQGDEAADLDDVVLERLRAAAALDAVPAEVVLSAKAAFTWRTIDAELAALAYDSADDDQLVGVRGSGPRALSFEAGDASIELEVGGTGPTRRIEGQIVPAGVSTLELHRVDVDEPMLLPIDDLGRFSVADVLPGRLRLLCRFGPQAGGGTLMTEWVLI